MNHLFGLLIYLTLGSFCLVIPKAFAKANNSLDEIFDLSLEELLQVKVITASKFEESIQNAHASISIITKEQIAQYGGTYLHEILERIVSVNSVNGVMTTISTRASTPWPSLVHHLALLNGRPFGNVAGGHNLYSSVPLSSIERIEYIRGPGSVLYGTNAYYGVFNIITKKSTKNGWQVEQKLLLGSFNNQTLDGSYRYKQGKLNLNLNMLYSDVDGWDAVMFDPNLMKNYSRKAFQTEKTLHLELQYDDFSISHYNSHQTKFANFWDAPEDNYIPWFKNHPAQLTDMGYTFHFNENWRLENHLSLIDKRVEWDSNGVADSLIILKANIEIKLLELNLFGQLTKDSTLLTGLTREQRTISNSQTIPDAQEDYASFYMQYQKQFNDYFSLMLGGQYVNSISLKGGVSNKSDFVPRAGLIFNINDDLALKLLYGQAYRQPTIGERFLDSPGIEIGNKELESEKIETLETQLYYQDNNTVLMLNYYNSKESNLIALFPTIDPVYPLEYQNKGELSSHGVELEYKYQPNQQWMFEFSWSWQENENKEGKKQTTLMPDTSWKLGVVYQLKKWQLGLYNLHYGDFQDTISIVSNRENLNPEAKGFDWLTLKVSSNLIEVDDNSSIKIALEIKNILDERIYYPQDVPTFYPINTVPGRAGRSVQLSLTYKMK